MTSFKQWQANRRNAGKSTGPISEEGKLVSRCNAVRHSLTAETVIATLEDVEDYRAFEAAIVADYDAQSAVERELVLRLPRCSWLYHPAIQRFNKEEMPHENHRPLQFFVTRHQARLLANRPARRYLRPAVQVYRRLHRRHGRR